MAKSIKAGIFASFAHFMTSDEIREDVDDLSLRAQAFTLLGLRAALKVMAKREKALAESIKGTVSEKGKPWADGKGSTAAGHVAINVPECNLVCQRKLAAGPDADKLRTLLEAKEININSAFTTRTVEVTEIDPIKLGYLIAGGKVSQAEVDALRAESFALVLEPTATLKAEIAGLGEPGNIAAALAGALAEKIQKAA